MPVEFGRTASDYARHRAGFPETLFERLTQRGVVAAGERLLDLGTGTGSLARGFARRGLRVTGLDPARPLLDQARRLDDAAGVAVAYVEARAESTGLAEPASMWSAPASAGIGSRAPAPRRRCAVCCAPEGAS